jgi:hypothetical protein
MPRQDSGGHFANGYPISKEATATMQFFTYAPPCNRVHPFRNNLRGAEVQLELVPNLKVSDTKYELRRSDLDCNRPHKPNFVSEISRRIRKVCRWLMSIEME